MEVTATFKERLKGVGIALIIIFGCMPLAIVVTIFTSSFWAWIEKTFSVETYGHSGPAEWCYWVSYALMIASCTWVWWVVERRTARRR